MLALGGFRGASFICIPVLRSRIAEGGLPSAFTRVCFLSGFPGHRTSSHDSTPGQTKYGRVVYQAAEPGESGIGFEAFCGDEVE